MTESFQASIEKEKNGLTSLEGILAGRLPEGMTGTLYDLSIDSEADRTQFDTHLLPLLRQAFTAEVFAPAGELAVGDSSLDYRGLRHLVGLVAQRAEQHWLKGDKESALELASYPLSLARAMQARPETASANLFSQGYASITLDLIPLWLESQKLDPEVVASLRQALKENSPSYGHVEQTVTVDFAQLLNSLETSEGRGRLGIGMVEKRTLEIWTAQVLQLYAEAKKLYSPGGGGLDSFNDAFRASAEPIQGVVIPYPEVATSQKHFFAKYKSTELGLALLSDDFKSLSLEQLIEKLYPDDEKTRALLKDCLELEKSQTSIRILGKKDYFALISPMEAPVLFEYHQDLGNLPE